MNKLPDPFRISAPALISFSGGRTSAYMLWRILDAYGGRLPPGIEVVFANTGKEREETLRFVDECARRWRVNVRWIEWRRISGPIDTRFAEVDYGSASRLGEPFAALIEAKSYLPNTVARFCTGELKVRAMKHYMLTAGYEKWYSVVGLRADERTRVERNRHADARERWTNAHPLYDAGITQNHVNTFWETQPFDLALKPFEGNCDGCFLKGRAKLWESEARRPGTLAWWASIENRHGLTFKKDDSYAALIEAVEASPDLFTGVFDDDPQMDAECGAWCAEAA